MIGRLKGRRIASRLACVAACVAIVSLGATAWRWGRAPRVWRPGEAKVAFWSWRARTPAQEEVESASRATGARVLFVRAGQFELASGRVVRIRAVEGELPHGIELHLVYNATPALLAEFEKTDEKTLASAFAETFKADAARDEVAGSRRDEVSGIQLDLDVPTRLLARYGRVLKETRALLPEGTKLSVTGLETWMDASQLSAVLDAVDFWLPQFYGAEIPATASRIVPVSSARSVRRGVERARSLRKPFYAGLAAYGYAILYSEKGKLIELRGDIDPARVAADRNFELVERRAFEPDARADGAGASAPLASEWRYVFRARDEAVLDGLVVHAGEQIVLDVPSSESLRASVRGVRESAGQTLLGICLFRLPTRGDANTLSLTQIAGALADREAETSTRLSVETSRTRVGLEKPQGDRNEKLYVNEKIDGNDDGDGDDGEHSERLLFEVENTGATGSLYGDDALALTLRVPRGSVRGVTRLEGFDSFETLCEAYAADDREAHDAAWQTTLRPCSAARASVVRLKGRGWTPGARARVGLSFEGELKGEIRAGVAVRVDDGRFVEREQTLSLRGAEGDERRDEEFFQNRH